MHWYFFLHCKSVSGYIRNGSNLVIFFFFVSLSGGNLLKELRIDSILKRFFFLSREAYRRSKLSHFEKIAENIVVYHTP